MRIHWLILTTVTLTNIFGSLSARAQTVQAHNGRTYSNLELGFHYVLPLDMLDDTESARNEIRSEAAGQGNKKRLSLLLAMVSGNDASPSWKSLTIQTYPRGAVLDSDDSVAEKKMTAWVAGLTETAVSTRHFVVSGQSFAVSVFGFQERGLRRGTIVWTTVRREKLLAFAFAANSPDQLKVLTETMKTVHFY